MDTTESQQTLAVLLTTEEVAEIFGVKPNTIRTWIKSGIIKAIKPNGYNIRITQGEVNRLVHEKYGDNDA